MSGSNILKAIYFTLLACLIITLYSYLFDCLYNFSYAMQSPQILGYYLIVYLVGRSWIFLLIIIVYHYLFRKGISRNVTLKISFLTAIAVVLAIYFKSDDVSLIIQHKQEKFIVTYLLSALTLLFFDEKHWIGKYENFEGYSTINR